MTYIRSCFITPAEVQIIKAATIGKCKLCNGAGRMKIVEGDLLKFVPCSCASEFDRRVDLTIMHIPPLFWDFVVSEESLDPDIKKSNSKALQEILDYSDNLKRAYENNVGLFIQGDRGLGKSAILSWLLKEAHAIGYTGYFTTLQELVGLAFKATKEASFDILLQQILTEVDFLVVDEIDKVYLSRGGEVDAMLDKNFTARYYANKPVWVTSNTLRSSLGDVYGKTVLDRFKESMMELTFKGMSIRPKLGTQLKEKLLGDSHVQ